MNGVCFDLDDFDDTYANGTANGAIDPAFRKIKKNYADFLIWRIENLQVVPVPKELYSTFYDTDSYIIFAASQYGYPSGPNSITRELKGGAEYHIHFWLGKDTTADKAGAAAYKTVELDGYLGGIATQHREVQEAESPRFRSYFQKTGMKVLTGGTDPALKRHIEHFEPILYRIKGKRAPVITQMPSIAWTHFNSGDVFLLQTAKTIFIWLGRASNHTEKLHASRAALALKTEAKIPNIIFVDDGYERTLHEDYLKEMEVYLPLGKRQVRPAEDEISDCQMEKNYRGNIKLYQCSDSSGKYRVTEVKSGPLKQSDINSDDVFILDHTVNGIWVWVGKRANDKERVEAMRNARGFVKKKKYPGNTSVTRVVDGAEPFEFKNLFVGWREKDETVGLVKGMIKPVVTIKVTKYDAETMYDRPNLAAKSQLLEDGSGTIKKWTIAENKSLIEIPKERNSVFFSSDCYIIKYSFKSPLGEENILFYWMGKNSIAEEQAGIFVNVIEMDMKLGRKIPLVRVVDGREPPHLLQILKGKMRVFLGRSTVYDPSGKNLKTSSHYLLQIEGSTTYNSKAIQVSLNAASLNSNFCFVLRKGSHYYVWCGNSSNGDNREIAKAFAGSDFALILEGSESPEFWHAIGGKKEYITPKNIEDKSDIMPPRLFQCSTSSGVLKCEEILNFTQQDLSPENIMLLDCHNVLYAWIGHMSTSEERNLSLCTAIEYLKSDPRKRDYHICMIQIKQGFEPPTFTGFFENWNTNLWQSFKTYLQLREEIEKENDDLTNRICSQISKVRDEFDQYEKYSIAVLTGPRDTLPPSIDPLKREVHLTYDDFFALTSMSYKDFKTLPPWKQQEIKKKVGLF